MKRKKFLCILVGIFFIQTLSSCGKLETIVGGASEPLHVQIALPEGSDPDLFWWGVNTKTLVWVKDGAAEKQFSLEALSSNEEDFSAPGLLRFEGKNQYGDLLVSGESRVNGQKQIFLLVQRVYNH